MNQILQADQQNELWPKSSDPNAKWNNGQVRWLGEVSRPTDEIGDWVVWTDLFKEQKLFNHITPEPYAVPLEMGLLYQQPTYKGRTGTAIEKRVLFRHFSGDDNSEQCDDDPDYYHAHAYTRAANANQKIDHLDGFRAVRVERNIESIESFDAHIIIYNKWIAHKSLSMLSLIHI